MTHEHHACGCGSDHKAGPHSSQTNVGAYLGAMIVGAMLNLFGGEILRLLNDTRNMVKAQTRIAEQHTRMEGVRHSILQQAIRVEKDMRKQPHPVPAPKLK